MDNFPPPKTVIREILEECESLDCPTCDRLRTLNDEKVDDTRELPLHCPSVKTDCPHIVLVLPHIYLSVSTAGSLGSRAVWIGLEKHKGAVTHMEVSLTLLPSDSVPDTKILQGKTQG